MHLTYFRTLNTNSMDERQSFNPLELLAHGTDQEIGVTFSPESVLLSVPMQQMRIRTIVDIAQDTSGIGSCSDGLAQIVRTGLLVAGARPNHSPDPPT